MKLQSYILLHIFGILFITQSVWGQQKQNQRYVEYINKYKHEAVEQMQRYHIPASITLAQGLLESGAGHSALTRKSNNHFGIKCGGSWSGKKTYHNDDAVGECFRVYKNARESYEDHSRFLATRQRYASLFKLKPTDYKGWAHGLKKAGYATDPNYGYKLINLIELYGLQHFDKSKLKSNWIITPHETFLANGLLYVIARSGDTFESLANEFEISARKIRKYNDLYKGYTLQQGDIIYLQKKRKRARKPYVVHRVEPGESMYIISQRYGIRLKNFYKLNRKDESYSPVVNELLRLR